MKVKDIMTRDVITLKPEMSVKEAAGMLFKLQISGLPVVDEEGRVVGMFTEKELLTMVLPSYIEHVEGLTQLFGEESLEKKFARADSIKVSEIMRKEVVCLDEDTDIAEAAKIMITKKARRIPVLRENKIVGIIARGDIVRELVKKAGI